MSLRGHLSRTCVAASLERPTWDRRAALRPYAVLLRMGFTWLLALPSGRWSLTPPFHPYLSAPPKRTCLRTGGISLLHWPWSYLRRPLAGILPCEARTFLPHSLSAICASGHVICLRNRILLLLFTAPPQSDRRPTALTRVCRIFDAKSLRLLGRFLLHRHASAGVQPSAQVRPS